MEDRIRIIVGILADTDAVFAPNRKWKRPRPTVIYEHRRDYAAGGVPWRSDAHDEAGRKAAQRQLEALCGEGLVKTYRPKRVKTLGVKLTEAGEALARAVCALPDVERSIGGVMHAAMAMDTPEAGMNWDGRIWIPETLLAGVSYERCAADVEERCKLFEFAEVLYPAMNRGWIISNSSIQGHVWYSPTPAGLAMLDAEHAKPDPPADAQPPADDDEDPFIQEAADYYLERFMESGAQFDTATPQWEGELGEIPLPVSMPRRKAG